MPETEYIDVDPRDVMPRRSVQVMYRPVVQDFLDEEFKQKALNFTREQYKNPMDEEEYAIRDWWERQIRCCRHGMVAEDGTYINPFYFFFLNIFQADILNYETDQSEIACPYYIDFQHEFADLLWYSKYEVREVMDEENPGKRKRLIKDATNIMLAKARRKGLTTMVCAYLMWLFLFGENLKLGYGYPDEETFESFTVMWEAALVRLPEMLKPNLIYPNNEDEIGNSFKNEKTGEVTTTNRIYWGNFGKETGKFRGKKLFFAFFDEAGKFKKWSRVKGSSKDCFRIGKRRLGYYVLGGTSDAITNEGFKDYKDDIDKPHLSNATRFLIYAYQGLHPNIDYYTGKSLHAAAEEYCRSERARLRKEGKSEDLRFEIQENPLSYEEFFMTPGGSIYDHEMINDQIRWIVMYGKEKEILRGRLQWEIDGYGNKTGKVEFVEDPLGLWLVYKNGMPVEGKKNLFFASFDDVYKDVAPESDSMPAMMVYKDWDMTEKESDMPVAIYLNDQKNRKKRFEDFLMGSIFWNAMTWGEINDMAMVNYYENKGYLHLLAKGSNDKFGYPGPAWQHQLKSQSEDLMVQYIENRRHERCYFIPGLNGIKDWGTKNTDIGICYHACLIYQNLRRTIVELEKIKPPAPEPIPLKATMEKPAFIPHALRKYGRGLARTPMPASMF